MSDISELTPIVNPFAKQGTTLATVHVEQERAIAEVQAAMLLARRFPRDPVQAMDRILNACTRPGLAEGALYTYSKGGSEISGPSIRLAETLAQEWGNIRSGVIELSRGTKDGKAFSEAKAYSWNLETNTYEEKIFQVPHWRDTKQGGYGIKDEREIYELVANVGARRKRACILAVIPGDVTEGAVRQCEVTLNANADTSPENMLKMVKAFQDSFGVTKEQIEKRIQRRIDSIQPAQVISLKKIFASMKDGMSAPEDWFEGAAPGETVKPSFIKKDKDAVKPKEQPKPEPEQTQAPAETPANDDTKERDSLLMQIETAREADGVSAKKVREWAHSQKLVAGSGVMLKDYETASLRAIVERWAELNA